MNTGIIYFNDKPMGVGKIPELHITSNMEDEKEPVAYFHPVSNECTLTMTLPSTNIKRSTNNWLKMHGGVMIRKIARRKRTL